MTKQRPFIKVSNEDFAKEIREELKSINDKLDKKFEMNSEEHERIVEQVTITNGKVRLAKWIGTTALSLIILIIFYLIGKL